MDIESGGALRSCKGAWETSMTEAIVARGTLFGHLALSFATHPENLATEALNFILGSSRHARDALAEVCSPPNAVLPPELRFRTQVAAADGAIPDLVGFDAAGAPRVLLEAKFWAGLTDRQPVDYLRRLPPSQVAALIFVGPSVRFPTLWPELLRRCQLADVPLGQDIAGEDEARWVTVGQDHMLGLVSWRRLLSVMGMRVTAAGDSQTAHEIEQLIGLSERMDADAFLPLRSEELGAPSPRRLDQLVQMLSDVAAVCVDRGISKTRRATSGIGWFGHQLTLRGADAFLILDVRRWATVRETPYWLQLREMGGPWTASRRILECLRPLALETPPRVLEDPYWRCPLVPLFLPFGIEREAVLDSLVGQIEKIDALIEPATEGAPPVTIDNPAQPAESTSAEETIEP